MSPVAIAKLIGAGRLLIGLLLIADPKRGTRGWIGADADRDGTQVVTRALGVRDALLGFLTLHVAGRPGVGSRTVAAIAVCDAVDFAATMAGRRGIPAAGAAGVGVLAAGSAIAGVAVSRKLPQG